MKRILLSILVLFLASGGALFAQNKNVARKHFAAGEYGVAKPMFEKLYKRNKNNAELAYWYAVCCYETKDTVADVKGLLEFAAQRKISNAYRYLGDICLDSAYYPGAIENYESFIDISTDDSLLAIYRNKLNTIDRLYRMMKTTEKVCVIDSFVVDKREFLSAYKMGVDVGRLSSVAAYFDEEDEDGGYLSETQMGTDIYYAMCNDAAGDTLLTLYHSSKIGDEWNKPQPLRGLDTGGNNNYPFMLADGLTLYFATDGEGSIGGYDIFVTRYDSESGRYLRPDNVGMPFNSQANDYMMAFNEVANLGWFASDRSQPEGKVCVYVFVPNSSNASYDASKMSYEKLFSLSRLVSIADTQNDAELVKKARRSFAMLMYEQPDVQKGGDFLFVLDNSKDYTALSDFKSREARTLFQKWQKESAQHSKNVELLQQKRDAYASSTDAARASMAAEILRLEKQVDNDYYSLQQMEYNVRKLEMDYLYKKNK